mmetsp:Transcript_32115/g.73421  ORF Transcript_32115/g.73421 Transcript_32115/m.73421 type:complete len:366 (+) Transcript_32115:98-1195(+)
MGGMVSALKGKKGKKNGEAGGIQRTPSATGAERKARRLSVTGADSTIFPNEGDRGNTVEKGNNAFLSFSALSSAGYEPDMVRKTNQDAFIALSDFGSDKVSLFGVFDGHGACGHLVSGFVVKQLPLLLNNQALQDEAASPSEGAAPVVAMLTKGFEEVNNNLERDKAIDSSLSGTTAVGGVIIGDTAGLRRIVMANAGDSRAVVAQTNPDGSCTAVDLSDDQKPDRPDEQARILQCGGRVQPLTDEDGNPIGPSRVWLPNMMLPGLAMSRSIGDDVAACVGVCATPEVLVHDLTPRDKFMVIASDGVWEFLTSQQVVDMVESCNGDADAACDKVVKRSLAEWRAEEEVVDDITCLVVYFNHTPGA